MFVQKSFIFILLIEFSVGKFENFIDIETSSDCVVKNIKYWKLLNWFYGKSTEILVTSIIDPDSKDLKKSHEFLTGFFQCNVISISVLNEISNLFFSF